MMDRIQSDPAPDKRPKPIDAVDTAPQARTTVAGKDNTAARKFLNLFQWSEWNERMAALLDRLIARGPARRVIYVLRATQLQLTLRKPMPIGRRLELQRHQRHLIERALENFDDKIVARWRLHFRTVQACIDLGENDKALGVARRLFERVDDARFSNEIIDTIALVKRIEDPRKLLALTEGLLATGSKSAELALRHAELLHVNGVPKDVEYEFLQRAREAHPKHPGILERLAAHTPDGHRVAAPATTDIMSWLSILRPNLKSFARYGRALMLRGKLPEPAVAFEKAGPRLDAAAFGTLGPYLKELCAACNRNFPFDAKTDLDDIRSSLTKERLELDAFLAANVSVTADDLGVVARKLFSQRPRFRQLARAATVTDALSENFGTQDLRPFVLLTEQLSEYIVTLLEHALSERVLSRPVKSTETIRALIGMYAGLLQSLGRTGTVRDKLEQLSLLGLSHYVATPLKRAEALHAFDASSDVSQAGNSDPSLHDVDIYRFAAWDEWTSAQGLIRNTFYTTPVHAGSYSIVTSTGEIQSASYVQQPLHLETAAAAPIVLRDSELLIGPKGILFQPHAIHGPFPIGTESLLAHTPRAVMLRSSAASLTINEPVVLLAMNNASRLKSYGHWIIFILTRLNIVAESGLLLQRKLLMPAELTPWMKQSLRLVGIPDERVVYYPANRSVIVKDAVIVSAIDLSAGDLYGKLKSRMRQGAGVAEIDGAAPSEPYLFIARKGLLRRIMLDEDRVYKIAAGLGYTIISPEQLSIAEQVRKFSRARAIAGPGGSAFANMVYCNAGTRCLCLKAEDRVSPFVLDLAVANGIDFRWLLGQSAVSTSTIMDVPYRVDLNQLEQQMAWAIETATNRP